MFSKHLLAEGKLILKELKSTFLHLPEEAAVRKPAEWDGKIVRNWLELFESVVENGPPVHSSASGIRFSTDVYELSKEISAEIEILSVTDHPTFIGNYPAPDDLSGQIIDLVAVHTPNSVNQVLHTTPHSYPVMDQMATHEEICELQKRFGDRTTVGSIGFLPRDIATIPEGQGVGVSFSVRVGEGGTESEKIQILNDQKVMLSDHMPIGFRVQSTEGLSLGVMSMNMLAFRYMPYSFWNTPPPDASAATEADVVKSRLDTELWTLAARTRAAADVKTKWLPDQYKSLSRLHVTEESLADSDGRNPMVAWERVMRRLWRWVFDIQNWQFKEEVARNKLAHDCIRLGAFAHMLAATAGTGGDADMPDLIFLQE
jgi:hypothetical protein